MINRIDNALTEQLIRAQLRPVSPRPANGTQMPGTVQTPAQVGTPGKSFAELLGTKPDAEIVFSKHAQKRLTSREITMSAKDMTQLKEVVGKLESKGARESLVLMQNDKKEDFALVVSVKNRTVITALTEKMMKDNIFTNIDSTVVLRNV